MNIHSAIRRYHDGPVITMAASRSGRDLAACRPYSPAGTGRRDLDHGHGSGGPGAPGPADEDRRAQVHLRAAGAWHGKECQEPGAVRQRGARVDTNGWRMEAVVRPLHRHPDPAGNPRAAGTFLLRRVVHGLSPARLRRALKPTPARLLAAMLVTIGASLL